MGLSQIRLGPNKVTLIGILQPVLDGLKLFKKINIKNLKSFKIFYITITLVILIVTILLLNYLPYRCWPNKIVSFMYLFFIFGLSSFTLILLGWSSLRKYATLGRVRSMCQTIRFEINLGIIIIILFSVKRKLSTRWGSERFTATFVFCFLLLITISLVECQRPPFDLREGERELVRGYNVEFSRILFTIIFLSEYLRIIIMSFILSWTILGGGNHFSLLTLAVILIVRSCFPRQRFDALLYFRWLKLLPYTIILFIWFYNFKIL